MEQRICYALFDLEAPLELIGVYDEYSVASDVCGALTRQGKTVMIKPFKPFGGVAVDIYAAISKGQLPPVRP